MYKLIKECGMPKWLKVLFNVLLTLTCFYWMGYLIYKILEVVRWFLHNVTEKKMFWCMFLFALIIAIGITLYLQFNTDVKPFTMFWDWLVDIYEQGRNKIADIIHT